MLFETLTGRAFFKSRRLVLFAGLLVAGVFAAASARANLVIDPTFGSSITSLSNASAVEAGIDAAISRLDAAVENPITVKIQFDDMSGGLGESDTFFNALPYSQYLSDLKTDQVLSANDTIAIHSLPVQTANPVNGNANIDLSLPLLRAIGESSLGDNDGGLDSTISLNLSSMNVSRTGMQNSNDYDLQAVATHEMDEVLGIGGEGSDLASGTTGAVGPLDLFRYISPGVRSYSQSANIAPYFSINGGTTELVYFNQVSGADYGDWGNGVTPAEVDGNSPPQVQDAFGTPGTDVNLGMNELTALDVVGWNLVAQSVPEPGTTGLLVASGLACAVTFRRRIFGSLRSGPGRRGCGPRYRH
jgi:hypothetical protein